MHKDVTSSGRATDSRFDQDVTEWLTPQDTIRIFRISKSKFYYWLNSGAFPGYKPRVPGEVGETRVVLVKRSDVQAFIESGRIVSTS